MARFLLRHTKTAIFYVLVACKFWNGSDFNKLKFGALKKHLPNPPDAFLKSSDGSSLTFLKTWRGKTTNTNETTLDDKFQSVFLLL